MTYQKNKPQAPDKLRISQGDLLGNFQALFSLVEVNHDVSTFTSPAASPEGKHKKVDMTVISAAPTALGTDCVLYNILDSDTTQRELFFKSGDKTYPISGGLRAAAGFAYIGGGMVMQWGQNSGGAGDKQITPSTAAPGLTELYHVQVTPFTNNDVNTGAMVQLKKMNTADFVVRLSNLSGSVTPIAFFWTVIGKK